MTDQSRRDRITSMYTVHAHIDVLPLRLDCEGGAGQRPPFDFFNTDQLGAFLLRLAMSEYRTIIHCTEELESALLSDRAILLFLVGEGFIEPNVYDDVTNPKSLLSASEKAGLLVTGIKDKVKLNPKNYHQLMRYFHQNRRMYGDIADILDKEYLKQGGKLTHRSYRLRTRDRKPQ